MRLFFISQGRDGGGHGSGYAAFWRKPFSSFSKFFVTVSLRPGARHGVLKSKHSTHTSVISPPFLFLHKSALAPPTVALPPGPCLPSRGGVSPTRANSKPILLLVSISHIQICYQLLQTRLPTQLEPPIPLNPTLCVGWVVCGGWVCKPWVPPNLPSHPVRWVVCTCC
jgi:hypothetical protein